MFRLILTDVHYEKENFTLAKEALMKKSSEIFMALVALFEHAETMRYKLVLLLLLLLIRLRSGWFRGGWCGRRTQFLDTHKYIFLMKFIFYAHVLEVKQIA